MSGKDSLYRLHRRIKRLEDLLEHTCRTVSGQKVSSIEEVLKEKASCCISTNALNSSKRTPIYEPMP